MTLAAHCDHRPAELSAAVEAAAEVLVIVWGRAQESLQQPVSASQLRALLVVDKAGEINLNGLAEELGAIPSSASRLCDRLQAAGLLTRTTGRTDRSASPPTGGSCCAPCVPPAAPTSAGCSPR